MVMEISHMGNLHTPYQRTIEVADQHSFTLMWNTMARMNAQDVLRGFGLEGFSSTAEESTR
jgi:hypothetical protein